MFNTAAAKDLAIVGTIDPSTVANTETFTDVVDMSLFGQAVAICSLGNMAAETIDLKAYSCTSGGTIVATVKSCTQLAAHATNNDNTQLVLNVRDTDVGSARYVKFGLVTGGATGGSCSVVVLGVDANHEPASANDLASVTEIKV